MDKQVRTKKAETKSPSKINLNQEEDVKTIQTIEEPIEEEEEFYPEIERALDANCDKVVQCKRTTPGGMELELVYWVDKNKNLSEEEMRVIQERGERFEKDPHAFLIQLLENAENVYFSTENGDKVQPIEESDKEEGGTD